MSGSKTFGPSKDFQKTSQPSGKPILVWDPEHPLAFINLSDTIASYAGHAGKFLVVKQTEDGVTVTTLDSITDAIAALDAEFSAIFDADPIAFGKNIDFEQFEALGFRLEQLATDPVSPVNGQLWYNTVENVAKIYQNNAIQPFFTAEDAAELVALRSELDIAKDDILTLENLIGNVADDGILSRTEKPAIVKEYQAILADQAGIDAEAVRFGITAEKNNYDNAITALTAYLTALDPAYDDYDNNTVIIRQDFIDAFNLVYSTKQTLLNKINSETFTTLQTTAQDAADAEAAASAAQADAQIAITAVGNMSDDGILSMVEKKDLIIRVSILTTEQAGIDAEADEHGVTTEKTNYDTELTDLTTYLGTLSPAWNDVTQDTPVIRNTFNAAFVDFYDARQECLNAIARASLTAAEDAQADATQALADASAASGAAATALSNANAAQVSANSALNSITIISSDAYLSKGEKPAIIKEYEGILAEQILLDAQAENYALSHTNYDNAVTALTSYLNGLSPAWNNTSQDTAIVAATFKEKFQDVYDESIALYLLIYDAARDAATVISDQAAALAHRDRTKVVFDGGFVTAGRFEVGNVAYGDNNAGMSGIVTGTPNTDIRFWAGSNYANRATAPFRVQNDGTMYSTKAIIAGWTVDSEAIYKGTKKISDGYATDGITLSGDGSIHAKNFYLNANGDVGIKGVLSLETAAVGGYNVKLSGQHIWEDLYNADGSVTYINYQGYGGGYSRARITIIGNGKGNQVLQVSDGDAQRNGYVKVTGKLLFDGWPSVFELPNTNSAGRNALTNLFEGTLIWNGELNRMEIWTGSGWRYFSSTSV